MELRHVTDRKTLSGLLAEAAPSRVQLWRFGEHHASRIDDVERVDEDLVETWWTAAASAAVTSGGYFVVLLVRDGRPHRWLLLCPEAADARGRDLVKEAQRARDRAVLRMASAGAAAGLRARHKKKGKGN